MLAFSLLSGTAFAQEVDLPEKTVFLASWDLWSGGGPWPWTTPMSQIDAHYAGKTDMYYRVLIFEDGSEEVIDRFFFGGTTYRTPYPGDNGFHFWRKGTIPAKTVEVTKAGNHSIELRHIEIPVPTAERNRIQDENSVVDWWTVERFEERYAEHDSSCTEAVRNICWREKKTADGVVISSRAEVYETYEFTIEDISNVAPLTATRSPGSPFLSGEGENKPAKDKAPTPFQMAAIGGMALLGAGALALSRKKAVIKTVLSEHGAKIEGLAAINAAKVKRIRYEYSRWWRGVQWGKRMGKLRREDALRRRKYERAMMLEMSNIERMYTREQKTTALEKMVTKYRGKMRKKYETKMSRFEENVAEGLSKDEKPAAAMSFTKGPPAVLKELKSFVPVEETVGTGAFNFIDALKLKEKHGYKLSNALGVAYEKNSFVQAVNELAYEIDETQSARINESDKYPWPLSSIVKFSAAFARETGVASTALIGNGLFALGSFGVVVVDSAVNPDDAGENFSAMGSVLMGSLFHGTEHMMKTVKEEDPEVGMGTIMSFVIAPEEAMLENSGRLARVSRIFKKMKKGPGKGTRASRIAKREVHRSFDVSERATLKTIEHSEIPTLSDLLIERMKETGTEWGSAYMEITEIDTKKPE